MVDNLTAGSETFTWSNAQPTAVRDLNGHLLMAWSSNRPEWVPGLPGQASVNDSWRIYIATLRGANLNNGGGGGSPLRDLNLFQDGGSRWFRHAAGSANGFPNQPLATLFGAAPGEVVLPETVKFGSPALPTNGFFNPFVPGQSFQSVSMAFLGQAQKQTGATRMGETRLFVAPVAVDGDGNAVVGAAVGMPHDPHSVKGKPAIVQIGANSSAIFYGANTTGGSRIFVTLFDGTTFSRPVPLGLGSGFETVGAPSAFARLYQGADAAATGSAGGRIIEVTFTGKLRGRPNNEVFIVRLGADALGVPQTVSQLPLRDREALVRDREGGLFRAEGLFWNRNADLRLFQRLNNADTDLEVPNTRTYDPETGVISFEILLGGRVYLDTQMGTVRFGTANPSRAATILLTYQPRVLRVTSNERAGHSGSSLLFDNRLASDESYWARDNSRAALSEELRMSRYVITYNRASAGGGQAARPYMRSMRLGVQLPTPIHTQQNGVITNIQVLDATSFYQVDPVNGRIYFTAVDEDRTIRVAYTGVDEATGNLIAFGQATYRIGLVTERDEAPVPIEQVVNEGNLTTFLDPFDPTAAAARRPGLIWMIWSSTRAGSPDLYFQTIAPRFTPIAGAR
jgi:hypothetical protein